MQLVASRHVKRKKTLLPVDLLGSKRLCLRFLMHRIIPRHSSLICSYFMWKVPQMLEICLVPITSVASQYPGLYIFSSPARMMRPVLNLAASKVEMIGTFEQVRVCSKINCFTPNLNSCSYWRQECSNCTYKTFRNRFCPLFVWLTWITIRFWQTAYLPLP